MMFNVFRCKLKHMLGPHEKALADLGYVGDFKAATHGYANDAQHKRAMGVLRARHETINRRLKYWNALNSIIENTFPKRVLY